MKPENIVITVMIIIVAAAIIAAIVVVWIENATMNTETNFLTCDELVNLIVDTQSGFKNDRYVTKWIEQECYK